MIIEMAVNSPASITEAQRVQLIGNSIIVSNVGDEDIYLDKGFTIPAGQSLEFGANDDLNMIVLNCTITFAGGGVNPLVEFMEMRPNLPQYNNYTTRQ